MGWGNMYPAMLKSENFQRRDGIAKYGLEGVDRGRPIQIALAESPPPHVQAGIPTLQALGIQQNLESLNGTSIGVMYQPASYRLSNHTRSYSVDYLPSAHDNLVLLFNSTVEKVILSEEADRATGVLIDGRKIKARKEVIVSGGSLLSPKISELSGIGQKTVLQKAGIEQLVDLPGVGENLQDHLRIQTTYALKPDILGLDILKYNATRAASELALWKDNVTSLYGSTGSCYGLMKWKQALGDDEKLLALARLAAKNSSVVDRKKLSLLVDLASGAPDLEVVFSAGYISTRGYPANGTAGYGKQYVTLLAGVMHPFARVSVDEYDPGLNTTTDAQWEKYAKDNVFTFYHPLGTCAMLPKADGGVVDPELKVYGPNDLEEDVTHSCSPTEVSEPGIPPIKEIAADPEQREQLAFERFLKLGIHGLYSTSIHDWIQPIIAENAKHSKALLVVCANIQMFLDGGPTFQFHQHFDRALQIFQGELSASNGLIKAPTLGAGLLLCTLSLIQGLPWTPHLLCMADLYNLHGDLSTLGPLDDLYMHHNMEVIGIMDLPNLVLGRTTRHLGIWQRFRNRIVQHDDESDPIEPVTGIPRKLLDICARIEEPTAEMQFWLWPGEIGNFMQCHLWDAWRFAGMLDHRRRWSQSLRSSAGAVQVSALPKSARLMVRLLSAMDSIRVGVAKPENAHMLVSNATLYPWYVASMEVEILSEYPEWQQFLTSYREEVSRSGTSYNTQILLTVIEEARERGSSLFDVDAAVRLKNAEIALF
ncbi:hypothetical protein NX059_005116 [Plenodomus lindquistii]|nr:hypothetical protein NX059_005116 [Plenodomus lindquistii]